MRTFKAVKDATACLATLLMITSTIVASHESSGDCEQCYVACRFEEDMEMYRAAFAKSDFRGWSLFILRNKLRPTHAQFGPDCRYEIEFIDKETGRSAIISEEDMHRTNMGITAGVAQYRGAARKGPPYAFRLQVRSPKPDTTRHPSRDAHNRPAIPPWYVLKA